jgi:ubiquinone/menaquinone biosynthesis C-methylase UbiE
MNELKDSKALSQVRFNRFAPRYVTSGTHAQGPELERLVEIAKPQPDWVVLDVATGGGHTALRFAPLVKRVVAMDIAPAMLDASKAFIIVKGVKNVSFRLGDAEDLPFNDEIFDLVTCRIAPHHFPDVFRFVMESVRVLKPDGMLLVQDHALPEDDAAARYIDAFERLRDPSHNRAFSESEWGRMLQDAGLTLEHTEQIVKRHEFQFWTEMQACTPQVVAQLVQMVEKAPEAVIEWMQPNGFGTPGAWFVNHHILIAGRLG